MQSISAAALSSEAFINTFDDRGITVVMLGTAIRSGTYLLHSFFDNHPNVLQLPKQHFYPFDWHDEYQHLKQPSIDDYWQQAYHIKGHVSGMGLNQQQTLDLKFPQVRERMQQLMPKLAEPVTRKTLMLLFYAAYADVHGIDLSQITHLLVHCHFLPTEYGWHSYRLLKHHHLSPQQLTPLLCPERLQYGTRNGYPSDPIVSGLQADFPNLNIINMLRHPMAGVYSYLKEWQQQSHWEVVHHQDLSSCYARSRYALLALASSMGLAHQLNDAYITVRFEDLHGKTQATLSHLADQLNLPWHHTLLDSTFGGVPWVVNIKGQLHQGSNPNRLTNEHSWQTDWDAETQHALLPLANAVASLLGYPTMAATQPQSTNNPSLPWFPLEQTTYQHQPAYLSTETHYFLTRTGTGTDPIGEIPHRPHRRLGQYLASLPHRHQFWEHYPQLCAATTHALLNLPQPISKPNSHLLPTPTAYDTITV